MNNSVNATFSQSQKSHNASTRCNNDLKISHKSGVDLTSEFFSPTLWCIREQGRGQRSRRSFLFTRLGATLHIDQNLQNIVQK